MILKFGHEYQNASVYIAGLRSAELWTKLEDSFLHESWQNTFKPWSVTTTYIFFDFTQYETHKDPSAPYQSQFSMRVKLWPENAKAILTSSFGISSSVDSVQHGQLFQGSLEQTQIHVYSSAMLQQPWTLCYITSVGLPKIISSIVRYAKQAHDCRPFLTFLLADAIWESVSLAIKNIPETPQTSIFELGQPLSRELILKRFRDHIANIKKEMRLRSKEPVSKSRDSPKIVVIMESITSSPSLLLPWQDMVRICHEEDVWSIVDAAHSLGQETEINLCEVNPDFWMTVSTFTDSESKNRMLMDCAGLRQVVLCAKRMCHVICAISKSGHDPESIGTGDASPCTWRHTYKLCSQILL